MNSKRNQTKKVSQSEQDDDESTHKQNSSENTRELRSRPKRKVVYDLREDQDSHQQQEQEKSQPTVENTSFLRPKIQMVVSKRSKYVEQQEDEREQYLVKYKFKSYYRCVWMSAEELQMNGYSLGTMSKKGLYSRMAKLKKMRLKQDVYFNPNYLLPDRILNSTDYFAAIQPKKANQIKGTWQQSLQLVCSKLFNFQKNMFPFGTLLIQPLKSVTEDSQKSGNLQIYSMPIVLNCIYFGLYKNYKSIWVDIGKAITKFIDEQGPKNQDFVIVGKTLRQATIFLYLQWYKLSLERYQIVKEQFLKSIDVNQSIEVDQYLNERARNNILLGANRAERPQTEDKLQTLNPGTMSLQWIGERKTSYNYTYLDDIDKQQLDLNKEVDKFYLVKWKEMSYAESTWERQSFFKNQEKIEEFNSINKMPNKELRQGLEMNLRIHQNLTKYYQVNSRAILANNIKKPFNIQSDEQKLYLFKKKIDRPKQYKGKDIITFKNYKLLKEFQNQSLNWHIKNWYQGRNTILADEMGLGKTIQAISFLYHLHMYQKVLGPFLILAPLTTLNQWRREIESWTNFNCLMYYDQGKSEGKNVCQTYQLFYSYTRRNGEVILSNIPKFHILLTNYQNFIRDYNLMKQFAFQHIVVDQAHKMKNSKTALSINLRMLPCRRITLLTGTPVQNNTKQLWALLNYIQPQNFPNQESFLQVYGNLNTQAEVARIKKMLKPYLLRRVKQDVQKLIPKLSEVIIDVQMTKMQKAIYKGLLQKNKNEIIKGLSTANFNNLAIQFRKCCNHPFLISADLEDQLLKDAYTEQQKNEMFLSVSGKMILLCKLLNKFREQKKKTLIFSQFVVMLQLLQDYLQKLGFHCQILHGGITASNRHRAISRFCQNYQVQIFLISTKAGGVGINLTAATEIVIYDSDWNPQNDIQATARAHRIGQKNQVTVYRLITSNSYESQMFKIASRKLGMDKAIFNGDFFKNNKDGNKNEFQQAMSKEQIEMLLKKGVLGFIENNVNEEEFFKQDIDQILQKNARKMEYSLGGDKNYTYSKSKFVGDKSSTHLDINSSNFWQVALKDIQSPIQKLSKKTQKLSQYTTLEMQQNLILELLNIVSEFVKTRVSGFAYNAQDERILYHILGSISKERAFNRQYRSIADKLVEEIEKPSRRFKVTVSQIKNIRSGIENPQMLRLAQEQQDRQNEEEEEIYDDRSEEENKGKNKKQKSKKKDSQKQPPQENLCEFFNSAESSVRLDYQKICFVCLKPKCSVFCQGICQRAFHKMCWNNSLSGDQDMVRLVNLKETTMKLAEWIDQTVKNQLCPGCKQGKNICYCSICGEKGVFFDQISAEEYAMTRCKNRNCNRFYHLNCVSQSQTFGWLLKLTNKRSQTQQGIFLDKFVCPVHNCFACGQRVSKASWNNLHSCIKCCKTYHPKCLPKATAFLHLCQSYYICEQHLSQSDRMFLEQDYRLIDNDKKNINQLKRMQKLIREKRRQKQRPNIQFRQSKTYQYSDIQLVPVATFDYNGYDSPWCRYCGSRFAENFCDSPWGSQKLCLHHYKFWKKGKLDLSPFKNDPHQPIYRKQTELKYINKIISQTKIQPSLFVDIQLQKREKEMI